MAHSVTLPLTDEEKSQLRKHKVRADDVCEMDTVELAEVLSVSTMRARALKGLAEFQRVPSIGYKLAEKLVFQLHTYSLEEIRDRNAAYVFNELEQVLGVWTDSCVEDQIRCVIHHANNPGSSKKWYDFTKERKAYREHNGYPDDRPTVAWYA